MSNRHGIGFTNRFPVSRIANTKDESTLVGCIGQPSVASHFYHEKRVAWVSISMHACDFVPIVMVLHSAALWAARAPLQINYHLL